MKWFDTISQTIGSRPADAKPVKRSQRGARAAIRSSEAYDEWREEVLERDDYTCQDCGAVRGQAELHAHHIVPMKKDLSVALEVANGVTLCEACHNARH